MVTARVLLFVQSLMGFKVSISASRWSMLHELGKCRESHSWVSNSLQIWTFKVKNSTLGGHYCTYLYFSFSSHEKSHINILNKLYAFNNCCFVDHSVIVLWAEKVEDILLLQLTFYGNLSTNLVKSNSWSLCLTWLTTRQQKMRHTMVVKAILNSWLVIT